VVELRRQLAVLAASLGRVKVEALLLQARADAKESLEVEQPGSLVCSACAVCMESRGLQAAADACAVESRRRGRRAAAALAFCPVLQALLDDGRLCTPLFKHS
jgi:hypothetical protein